MDSTQPQDVPLARPVRVIPGVSPTPTLPYARLWNPLLLIDTPPAGALLDAGLVTLTAIVAHYLPQIVAMLLRQDVEIPQIGWPVVAGKWLEALLVVGLLMYLVLRHGNRPASHGVRVDRPAAQVGWGLLAWVGVYAYMLATMLIFAAVLYAMPGAQDEIKRRIDFVEKIPVADTPLIVVLLVAVAIHEELLFRGLLLPLLRRATGRWWVAVLLTSALFGVLHFPQGWMAVLQITGLSLVLSLFFIWSRSLLAVMLAHFLFDFCQVQLMRLLPNLTDLLKQLEQAKPG